MQLPGPQNPRELPAVTQWTALDSRGKRREGPCREGLEEKQGSGGGGLSVPLAGQSYAMVTASWARV